MYQLNTYHRPQSCKLFKIRALNNEVLLYGMGNCLQYPVINHMGKNIRVICVCITEALSGTAEMNIYSIANQLCFNKIFKNQGFPILFSLLVPCIIHVGV